MTELETLSQFRSAYAAHRAAEGRTYTREELQALPYLKGGRLARQWRVRARSYEVFMRAVLPTALQRVQGSATVADLGAGNGWLGHRIQQAGHNAICLDVRTDEIDGLGAAVYPNSLPRVGASFEALPLATRSVDLTVFNASLHYALDLRAALHEAVRVLKPRGTIAIIDSPFYDAESDGLAMVAEKHSAAPRTFGGHADALLALPFIEFLTHDRLLRASARLGLSWRRHRVRYPLWYELRPWWARLQNRRAPSRFDVWEATAS